MKAFQLFIGVPYEKYRTGANIDDVEVFNSIVRSQRRIEKLELELDWDCPDNNIWEKLMRVIDVNAENILEFGIDSSDYSSKELELINRMPNIQKLGIHNYWAPEGDEILENFQLRLNNLRDLQVVGGKPDILEIFDHLPDNSLRRLRLNVDSIKKKYFGNQQKLEEITTSSIESLDMDCTYNVTFLDVYFGSQEDVDKVCKHFKSLESIRIHSDEFVDLSSIENLKNLKKIDFSRCEDIIETLKSKSIESLEFYSVSIEILSQLGLNCPNLRELKLPDNLLSSYLVDEVLRHFPKLERLECNSSIFGNAQSCKYQNIKQLIIREVPYGHEVHDIPNFIRGCKNLETFSMDVDFDAEQLKDMMRSCPNLKSLCIATRSKELFRIVKKHGNNLRCLHIGTRQVDVKEVKVDKLMKYFDGQFTHFSLFTNHQHNFVLKKSLKEKKCCNFLPV